MYFIIVIYLILFLISDPPFSARETLRAWQEKNHPWLELSDVHKETTENIRITVIPFYMGQRVSIFIDLYNKKKLSFSSIF